MKILAALAAGLVLLLALGAGLTWLLSRVIESRYPPRGRFVAVAGGRLHVIEAGPRDRPPLGTIVLLHGASGSAAEPFLALGRRLSERCRVLAFDRPGHGWSDRIAGADAASPARQAAILAEGLRALGVSRAVIVAHSLAGSIAPNLALDHPDVTGGLVLLAPVTHPWPGGAVSWYYGPATSWLGWLFTRTLTTPLGLAFMGPAIAGVFAPQTPPAGYLDAAQVPLVLRPPTFQANAQDVAGLYAAVSAQAGRYRNIRVPTVVISGDADPIVWTDLHSRALEREIPDAKLIVLPGVGHMPHHVEPALIAGEIEALATRIGRAQESRAAPPAAE
jgi:pimeloyl-ACP methyl ester carboxylesterase